MFPELTRLISISELVSQQHLPCVSNLSWSTNQQRAWVKEAELSLPGHQALQRVNLLLTGCLEEGRGGEWRLRDASGSVRCEVGAASCCLGSAAAATLTAGHLCRLCSACLFRHCGCVVLSSSLTGTTSPVHQGRSPETREDTWN